MRTIERAVQNLAVHSTDLKHAQLLKDTSAEVGGQAKLAGQALTNLAAVSTAPGPQTRFARPSNSAPPGQPPRTSLGPTEKLAHIKRNNVLSKMSPEVRALKASRDKVHTQQEMEKLCDKVCPTCPPDAPNMPHNNLVCPVEFAAQEDSEQNLGKVRATRQRLRISQNMSRLEQGQPLSTYAAMVALARALDAGDEDTGYECACAETEEKLVALCMPVSESTSADTFAQLAEYERQHSCNLLRSLCPGSSDSA